ncbi:MAG: phosphoribosyltransferase family protein [Thermoguttaceae bacterium]
MKRRGSEPLSAAMGRLLATRRAGPLSSFDADLILPIPMYWTRKLARGTNSPETVARRLAAEMRIPVSYGMLRRKRNTLPQKDLPTGQRFRNVRGAFAVRRSDDLHGARVVLVDDILTTGATCSEAAGVLRKAGAAMVAAVVIARAQGPNAT